MLMFLIKAIHQGKGQQLQGIRIMGHVCLTSENLASAPHGHWLEASRQNGHWSHFYCLSSKPMGGCCRASKGLFNFIEYRKSTLSCPAL